MANPNSNPFFLRAVLIIAASFWVFAPSLHGGWLMDDAMYVTQNALLNDPLRLLHIWFRPGSLIEYYPISASVQAIQWRLWQLDTFGYHLTNIVLHAISALLVCRLLEKFGLRFAWLGGFLFAVHPANVESVAWISELKNTLSLPPFLIAMLAWIAFEEKNERRCYWLSLGFFFIAMLCKVSMAAFPVVILLYAWWKRGRVGLRDLKHAAPFFAVALGLALLSTMAGIWYREALRQALTTPDIGGFDARVVLAGTTIAFYFSKCILPIGMVPIYPRWSIDPHSIVSYTPWLVLAGGLFWSWQRRDTWGRGALLGLGFFLLNLLPFIGFIPVSYQGYTWAMDHLLYIPLIGVIGVAIALLGQIEKQLTPPLRPVLMGMTAVTLALLALGSQLYAGIYSEPEKFWSYTLARNPTSWVANNNLGNALLENGRTDQAIIAYENALRANPGSTEANNNIGVALVHLGRTQEAIGYFERTLRLNSNDCLAHKNLADALAKLGREDEARYHYERAVAVDPKTDGAR